MSCVYCNLQHSSNRTSQLCQRGTAADSQQQAVSGGGGGGGGGASYVFKVIR